MKLTFSELKEIKETSVNFREAVKAIKNLPKWLQINSFSKLKYINKFGVATNSHPLFVYYNSKDVFLEHEEEIEQILEESSCKIVWDVAQQTFTIFAEKVLVATIQSEVRRVMNL